jgi:phospholipase A-2-activating protein
MDRVAPAEEREAFAHGVEEALLKHKKGPSQEEVSNLPKWEMNSLTQGKSEGQVQLFQKGGVAIAA